MRVLVTGLSTYWGGRLAQSLEQDHEVEAIIGIDRRPPKVALERTEFVQVADAHSLIQRIVQAAEIDTVVDTRLVVDSTVTTPQARAREQRHRHDEHPRRVQRARTRRCASSSFRSSAHYYGAEQDDPAFFTEDMSRPHPPRTRIERDIVEAENAVADFAAADDAGEGRASCASPTAWARDAHRRTRSCSRLPAVPTILGFDPRYQFIHEDDIVGVPRARGAQRRHRGRSTTARPTACSRSARSSACSASRRCRSCRRGGRSSPRSQLRRARRSTIPDEMLAQLRFGRGLDNRKLKATGYRFRYTTRETVLKFREALRLEPMLETGSEPLPLRARGRGVPALQPERPRRVAREPGRRTWRRASAQTALQRSKPADESA